MKNLSPIKHLALSLAKFLPRGWSHVLYWAARRYPELSRYEINLKLSPKTRFRIDLNQSVCLPLFKWRCYPHQEMEDTIGPSLLRAGEVVFDIGANIGYTAALFSSVVGATGRIYAFEPAKNCLALLKENAGSLGNVTVVSAGVSEKSGSLLFEEQATLDTSHLVIGDATSGRHVAAYSVPVISLDEFASSVGAVRPILIKVDVEGHEPAVFRGAAKLLKEARPIVLFEALDKSSLSESLAALESVAPVGYRTFQFLPEGKITELSDNIGSNVNNYIAVPSSEMARLAPYLA